MSTTKDDLPLLKTFVVCYQLLPSHEMRTCKISAHTPVAALNGFHRLMQDERELKPGGYQLGTLAHRYASNPTMTPEYLLDDRDCTLSFYDLPATPNPDIKWERKKKRDDRNAEDPTNVMPFYHEVTNPAPEK